MTETIICRRYMSPCGALILGSYADFLCLCVWDNPQKGKAVSRLQQRLNAVIVNGSTDVTQEAARQLDEYFVRKRQSFSIPLLTPGTEFQQAVWQTLSKIPYGKTISYTEEAMAVGKPSAVRAVASANAINALSIFIPCHRVLARNSSLAGYQGGIAAKQFLISLESGV